MVDTNQQYEHLKQVGKYIVIQDYNLGKESNSYVYSCYNEEDPSQKLVSKVVSVVNPTQSESFLIKKEIKLQKSLKSEYLTKIYDVIRTKHINFIFLQKCECTLASYLQKQQDKKLDEAQAIKFTAQIVEGYKVLYQKQIPHHNIKPTKILLDNGKALLTGFGLQTIKIKDKQINNKQQENVNTIPYYKSPLLLVNQNQDPPTSTSKCDVWSLGTILYEMINGQRPWDAEDITNYKKQILSKPLVFHVEVSEPVKDLIIGMLQVEEKDRLSWEQVFKHPAITAVKL